MSETEIISLVVGVLRANPRAAVILGAVAAFIAVVGNVWQLVSKEKREALKLRRPYVAAVLEFIASIAPLVVRAARVVKYAGKPRDGAPPSSTPPASPGFAILPVIGTVALAFVIGFALAGCPRLPAPDGCGAGAVRCSPQGVPQLCDPQGRWTPMDDQCSRHGAACCVTRAYSARLIAVCLPEGEVCNGAQ